MVFLGFLVMLLGLAGAALGVAALGSLSGTAALFGGLQLAALGAILLCVAQIRDRIAPARPGPFTVRKLAAAIADNTEGFIGERRVYRRGDKFYILTEGEWEPVGNAAALADRIGAR